MKRLISGRVSSDSGDKTIIVRVVIRKTHPLYRKQYTQHRKFMAHDENNQAKVGDLVTIRESRPLSARKRFVLDEIVEHAQAGFEEADARADVPIEESEKKEQLKRPVPPAKNKAGEEEEKK